MAEEAAEAVSETVTDSGSTPEPAKTFTQEQVNDLIAREKGKIQNKYVGFDEIKAKAERLDEIEAANASELEKAQKAAAKAQGEAADAATKLLRFEVAQEKEVPAKLVPLLTAASKEELEVQADLILENAKPAQASFDGGTREPSPDPKTPERAHSEALLGLLGVKSQ